MKHTFFLMLILFGFIQTNGRCEKSLVQNSNDSAKPMPRKTPGKKRFDRLPDNITPETQAVKELKNDKGDTVSFEITTVEKILNELRAEYKTDQLVDGNGREIRFYEPLCRGVSRGAEGDKEDRKAKENELSELKKNYTVVTLYCDPRRAS